MLRFTEIAKIAHITMKHRLNIKLQKEVYSYLKRNRKNISKYVEQLVTKDVMKKHSFVAEQSKETSYLSNPITPVLNSYTNAEINFISITTTRPIAMPPYINILTMFGNICSPSIPPITKKNINTPKYNDPNPIKIS
jgi:hypothetical protein